MSRAWVIWVISALSAILVLGAMGVISSYTLDLEQDYAQAEAERELQERVRLAMWRLDTVSGELLTLENRRLVRDFEVVKEGEPKLFKDVPDYSRLYFSIAPSDKGNLISSVQLVRGTKLDNSDHRETSESYAKELDELIDLFGREANSESSVRLQRLSSNIDLTRLVANTAQSSWSGWHVSRAGSEEVAKKNFGQLRSVYQNSIQDVPKIEAEFTANETRSRKDIVSRALATNFQAELPAELPNKSHNLSFKVGTSSNESEAQQYQNSFQNQWVSPFSSLWLADELVIVRKAQWKGRESIQGVLLDRGVIVDTLLKTIGDYLPEAKLQPLLGQVPGVTVEESDSAQTSALDLSLLPFRLVPNESVVTNIVGLTPIRRSLFIAWVGAVIAILAGWAILHGVLKLSERRASFVSSVTHELRTPLTTFKLYSELLASGMVENEDKRQFYLKTLCKESDRLGHLVENVLAYSQIERGSARARLEEVTVGSLFERMKERWSNRGLEDDMCVSLEYSKEVGKLRMKVDITSVDQIMFNLVDNACKYGRTVGPSELTVEVKAETGSLLVYVMDQGPGVRRSERHKLFKPFHKSAVEAAHTKPGVGLGLALCKRLAKAMGGDLRLGFARGEVGACFVLSLPREIKERFI